jgi:uncharacterized coiled-coil protein SlyX
MQISQHDKTIAELNERIVELEKDLEYERNQNLQLFVDQEVS